MDYFPAFLKLHEKPCLLVGGGQVAARKARQLLAAGARLTVVAPDISPALAGLVGRGKVRNIKRSFRGTDVRGYWLVVCAADDRRVQRATYEACERAGIWCNSVDDIDHCSYLTPAIVDRSPVVVAVSSGGAAPVLARKIRARIEAVLPAAIGRLANFAHAWRDRVNRRIGDASQRRRFWERFFDGPIANAVHANAIDEANRAVDRMLEHAEESTAAEGEAWLVGAGPGDPGLLTLRAMQILQMADVIVHDRLVSDQVLAFARLDAERIAVGKTPGCRQNSQQETNELLVRLVTDGHRVCRLKGGDPFIFGRGGEEVEALAEAGLRYQVVPGITAAAGCAAYSGIPLTHREASQSVVLLTAHGKDSVDRLDWVSLARDRQTLAFYMAVGRFGEVMRELIKHGRSADTPVAIIEKGTTPGQRVFRGSLGQLTLLARAHQVEAPAMLIVGEVAKYGRTATAARSDSFESDPAYEELALLKTASHQ